jgi:hypothetical protein
VTVSPKNYAAAQCLPKSWAHSTRTNAKHLPELQAAAAENRWLARSWAHYGSDAGGPSVGAIVVWRHHVGKIVGHENGQWIVQRGNDGHAVRTRPRSLAGAIAFRQA